MVVGGASTGERKIDTSFYAEDGREKRTKRFRREAGAPRVTPRVDKVSEVDLNLISPYSILHPPGESLLLSLVLAVVLCTGVRQGTRTGRCTREGTLVRRKGPTWRHQATHDIELSNRVLCRLARPSASSRKTRAETGRSFFLVV